MNRSSFIGFLVLSAWAMSAQQTQQAIVAQLSPAPLWPRNGSVPPELKGHSVFFNPETSEIVVLPDVAGAGAKPITFELRSQATPTVVSRVSPQASAGYGYEYRIGASVRSRRPLQQWSVLVPAEDPKLAAQPPVGWTSQQESTNMVDRPAPKHLPLKYIHFIAAAGAEVPAGASVPGFRLVSNNTLRSLLEARSASRSLLPL